MPDPSPLTGRPEIVLKRPPLQPATLYLVATPIGNLEDITLRALRTLQECDAIAAEDTRHTSQLLRHYQLHKPLLSCHHFNEARRSEDLIERLRQGQRIAMVTDAGSPAISDPGERVVRKVLDAGFRVESVPGPCALVAALTASGLPTTEFHFVGFLPHKSSQRRRQITSLASIPGTLVFYESPYRISKLLQELHDILPHRLVVVARELTKLHEEYRRGLPARLLADLAARPPKGEVVVMVEPELHKDPTSSEPLPSQPATPSSPIHQVLPGARKISPNAPEQDSACLPPASE